MTIHFEAVSKHYPGNALPAVNNVTLEIPSGAFVVLLGPSGCGKTTLLKMVNRLVEPDAGRVLLDGADIRGMEVTELRRRIGYVIQQVGLFPHMTVAQNVAVVPQLLRWPRERTAARVDELLELVNLPPEQYRARYPAQLSGGQAQRVGLARALAADPGVMLMDEPFGAIDAITRACLQEEMLALQRRLRKTALFVTHDVEEALRLADRIVILEAGQVVQYDTPFAILQRPANAFVSELVGAEDSLRQLALLRVEMAMAPLPPGQTVPSRLGEPIAATDNLREALARLLKTGQEALVVLDGPEPVGTIGMEQVRRALRREPAAEARG